MKLQPCTLALLATALFLAFAAGFRVARFNEKPVRFIDFDADAESDYAPEPEANNFVRRCA